MNFRLFLLNLINLTLLLNCSDNSNNNDICGDQKEASYAIVNGENTHDKTIVDLTQNQIMAIGTVVTSSDYNNFCTASLISDKVVLTAAHCLDDNIASEVGFMIGDDISTSSSEYFFQADQIYYNPSYQPENKSAEYDVGVLILKESPIDRLGDIITPLYINRNSIPDSIVNSNVQIAGYGLLEKDGAHNTKKWWAVGQVTNKYTYSLLVGDIDRGKICFGDSGGPLLWTLSDGIIRIIGVTSLTINDCLDGGYFTRVDKHMDWLKQYLPCEGLDEIGECNDNLAKWCDNDNIVEIDCGILGDEYGYKCEFDENNTYRCVDPCHGITKKGYCEGNTATWCNNGTISTADCTPINKICSLNNEENYRCVDSDSCNGISYQGYCEGNIATWCNNNAVSTINCDDFGLICKKDNENNYRCLEEIDNCNGVTLVGYCDDEKAVWCDMNYLSEIYCENYGLKCGLTVDGYYRCLNDAEFCESISTKGYCDDNTAVWCENDSLQEHDCSQLDQVCGEINGNYRCKSQNNSCQGLTYQGICTDDNKVQWCENDQIKTRDCTVCNQTCGWINDTIGYYCN